MIELFSRKPEKINLNFDPMLTTIHISDNVSSLSAQSGQNLHIALCISVMAYTGHSLLHFPQLMHNSVSICAIEVLRIAYYPALSSLILTMFVASSIFIPPNTYFMYTIYIIAMNFKEIRVHF